MIFTAPLQPGTLLVNVLYKWLVNGAFQPPSSSGITQPDSNFPIFRIDTGGVAPVGAEELIVYDSTALSNWNPAGYRAGFAALAGAQQVLLGSLWVPSSIPQVIVPASPAQQSICRLFGTFTNLMNVSSNGLNVTFTLVQGDATDPTILYNVSGLLIYNRETGSLVGDRVVNAAIVAGALTDINGNSWQDLTRTDYMNDQTGAPLPRMKYLLTFPSVGAQVGLGILPAAGPNVFSPVTFLLDTSTVKQSTGGTFDLTKVVPG